MTTKSFVRSVVIFVLALSILPLRASPVPASVFGDHMVLQRGKPIVIWGSAKPGEHIRVSIKDEVATTVADTAGKWRLSLPAIGAGGPFTLVIEGEETVILRDIMIGEVWLFSGQSNMTFSLSRASNAEAALASANHPQIRLLTIPQESSLQPVAGFKASWEICTPASAHDFSAVAYFFGIHLAQELGVPIGLIHSSWPGSTAEEWVSHHALESEPDFAAILKRWQQEPSEIRNAARDGFPFDLNLADVRFLRDDGSKSEIAPFSQFEKMESQNAWGGFWTYSWDRAAHSRFEIVSPGAASGTAAARLTGRLTTSEDAVLRSSLRADNHPADLSTYSGLQLRFSGNGYFQIQFLQPSVTDAAEYSSPTFYATEEWQTITIPFRQLRQPEWGVQMPFTQASLSGFQIVVLNSAEEYPARPPSGLYNGMIASLAPFPVGGFVWYQGESNTERAYQYRRLLPALIQDWRAAWESSELPFLIVQLPNHGSHLQEPAESGWAELREAQSMASKLPNVGVAVTIDLGEANNVHPPDKADVGGRLALLAEGMFYGKPVLYSGPIYESAEISGRAIHIRFRKGFGKLRSKNSKPLAGFSIADSDRKFVWADARIEGDEILVSSPAVQSPKAVRYAWADNPDGNLTNDSGIPASPFRTDEWPGITAGKN